MILDLLKIQSPNLPNVPGLYQLITKTMSGTSSYIGESSNLKRRMQNYCTPGKSQQTNLRMNSFITDILRSGGEVAVSISTEAWIDSPNKTQRCEMNDKAVRRLFENLAILDNQQHGYEILNK